MRVHLLPLFLLLAAQSAAQPLRIISLSPADTEILFSINASSVIAASNFCDWPARAKSLEKVGDSLSPAVERIVQLKPDVVFTGKWQSSPAAARLRRMGIKVVEIDDAKNIEDIYRSIEIIGKETARTRQAAALIKKIRNQLDAVARKTAGLPRKPSVYIEITPQHWTAGKNSFLNDVLEKAGGENIFSDLDEAYAKVSWELVVKRNPDIILSLSPVKTDWGALPGASAVNAISNDRIIDYLDKSLLSRPAARIGRAVELLHHELFKAD